MLPRVLACLSFKASPSAARCRARPFATQSDFTKKFWSDKPSARAPPLRFWKSASRMSAELDDQHRTNDYNSVNVGYHARISMHFRQREYAKVEEVYKEMTDMNIPPTRFDVTIFMLSALGLGDMKKAFSYFDLLRTYRIPINKFHITAFIKVIFASGEDIRVYDIWDDVLTKNIELSVEAYTSLIKIFGHLRDTENIHLVMDQLRQHRLEMTEAAYSTLVEAYGTAGMPVEAQQYFVEMMQKGFTPNAFSFRYLLDGYIKRKEFDKAFSAYEAMTKHLKIQPDIYIFSSLMSACAEIADVERAIALFNEFVNLGVPESTEMYNVFLEVFVKAERFNSALFIFDAMKKREFVPNGSTYDRVFRSLEDKADLEEAKQFYQEMHGKVNVHDSRPYDAYMNLLAKRGKIEETYKVFEDLKRMGLQPTPFTYTVLINACGHVRDLPRAKATFAQMKQRVRPTPATYNVYIGVCITCGDYNEAWRAYEEMNAIGLRPQLSTYSTLQHMVQGDTDPTRRETIEQEFKIARIEAADELD